MKFLVDVDQAEIALPEGLPVTINFKTEVRNGEVVKILEETVTAKVEDLFGGSEEPFKIELALQGGIYLLVKIPDKWNIGLQLP